MTLREEGSCQLHDPSLSSSSSSGPAHTLTPGLMGTDSATDEKLEYSDST